MKFIWEIRVILFIAVIFSVPARGQGFLNLNFDSAQNLPGNPGEGVLLSVTNALPDWTAYQGGLLIPDVYYFSNFVGGADTTVELFGGSLALTGNDYSVLLTTAASIGQTGLVPGHAESLQFEAYISPDNALSVTLGGQSLSYSALSEGPDYTVYGANIPADLGGQMETLSFLVQGNGAAALLDNIEFSTMIVPEPSEFRILVLGAILVGIPLWRKFVKPITRTQ